MEVHVTSDHHLKSASACSEIPWSLYCRQHGISRNRTGIGRSNTLRARPQHMCVERATGMTVIASLGGTKVNRMAGTDLKCCNGPESAQPNPSSRFFHEIFASKSNFNLSVNRIDKVDTLVYCCHGRGERATKWRPSYTTPTA